jgi:hypothetical protein
MGQGDDLAESFDVNSSGWEITRQELLALRTAITAYNQRITSPPLPHSWVAIVHHSAAARAVAPGHALGARSLRPDAWGNAYVPQGNPVNNVISNGPR